MWTSTVSSNLARFICLSSCDGLLAAVAALSFVEPLLLVPQWIAQLLAAARRHAGLFLFLG